MDSRNLKHAAGLGLLLLGVYLLTASGHFYAFDERQMYALTEALATRGSFALNEPGPDRPPVYSKYGPGQSIAALPLFWLGSLLSQALPPEARPWFQIAVVLWFNPLVTALIAALLYLAGRRIADEGPALLTALIYGLGTMAWPYTQTFFAEPLNALLWLGALLLIWRPDQPPPPLWAFAASGLLAGLAPAVKIQAGLALPLLGLYALWTARLGRHRWRLALAWGGGAGAALAALALYNAALFGSPLRTGYGDAVLSRFTAPFWEGFSGQLWGLRRGLIWASPLMLLAPLGLLTLWRRDRALAVLCAAMALAHVLFYATWFAWDGGGAWGPRFLNAVLPFLCLPLATLWTAPPGRVRWVRIAAVGLAALTLPVQFGALAVNMNQFFGHPQPSSQVLAHLSRAAELVVRAADRHLAPGRVVLVRGFAPSEDLSETLFPRWSLDRALIRVRPGGAPAQLVLSATSCPVVTGPSSMTISIDGKALATVLPCPGRIFRLFLPPVSTEVILEAPTWRPSEAGMARDEDLGIFLSSLSARAGGRPLRLAGDPLPLDPLPLRPNAMRDRLNDPRIPVWDFWWIYLHATDLPKPIIWRMTAAWLGLALIGVGAGGWLLRDAMRPSL